jgi:hypothetical protein
MAKEKVTTFNFTDGAIIRAFYRGGSLSPQELREYLSTSNRVSSFVVLRELGNKNNVCMFNLQHVTHVTVQEEQDPPGIYYLDLDHNSSNSISGGEVKYSERILP